jgi:hypothetical protein
MRLLVPTLLISLAMIVLSLGQGSVHIGGNDGLALLKNLTNGSWNLTGTNIATNTTSNMTSYPKGDLSKNAHFPQMPKFIGNGGKVLLKNLTNSSLNLTGNNNTSDLSTWGGKPLPPPVPTLADYFNYQNADVVKANRE